MSQGVVLVAPARDSQFDAAQSAAHRFFLVLVRGLPISFNEFKAQAVELNHIFDAVPADHHELLLKTPLTPAPGGAQPATSAEFQATLLSETAVG